MTDQEIFDTVAKHLLTQGRQSITADTTNGGFMCKYRGPDGLKCAVGALIADDEYSPDMEENDVEGLKLSGLLPERLVEHCMLLDSLQSVHDCTDDGPNFRAHVVRELREVARVYDLVTVVLEEAA